MLHRENRWNFVNFTSIYDSHTFIYERSLKTKYKLIYLIYNEECEFFIECIKHKNNIKFNQKHPVYWFFRWIKTPPCLNIDLSCEKKSGNFHINWMKTYQIGTQFYSLVIQLFVLSKLSNRFTRICAIFI